MPSHDEYKHIHGALRRPQEGVRAERVHRGAANRLRGESVPVHSVSDLVHALRQVHGVLDFAHGEDAGEHLLELLFRDGLRGVPDGAVGSDHGLGGQVEGVVSPLGALRADGEGGAEQRRVNIIARLIRIFARLYLLRCLTQNWTLRLMRWWRVEALPNVLHLIQ